ncbi:MAG: PQQ-like beta-propeller repeat protein [Acidobacteria bacterium]|nr:PQQ-like beta-propeller repeat protein [Acidobacteriota bacterium]
MAVSNTSLKAWLEGSPPAQVWRRPIGEGFSGITIFGNHLLTAFGDGKTEFIGAFERATGGLFAVNITTGKQIWNVLLTEKFKIKRPLRGFSTSPIVMGDTLIIHGGGRRCPRSSPCRFLCRRIKSLFPALWKTDACSSRLCRMGTSKRNTARGTGPWKLKTSAAP